MGILFVYYDTLLLDSMLEVKYPLLQFPQSIMWASKLEKLLFSWNYQFICVFLQNIKRKDNEYV